MNDEQAKEMLEMLKEIKKNTTTTMALTFVIAIELLFGLLIFVSVFVK